MAGGINELATYWRRGTILNKVIYANIAVFIVLRIIGVACFLVGSDVNWLLSYIEWPSEPSQMLTQPWTLFTYMFAHYDVLHILFNMLWLYWFGVYFSEFGTPKQFFVLYLLGGIGGAALFAFAYNIIPAFSGASLLIGASASILAIVAATAWVLPHYEIRLLLIGAVKLKWVAIITIFIDFLSISGDNSGGHIAHLGGAIVGMIFGMALKRGADITAPFNRLFDSIAVLFSRRKGGLNPKNFHYRASTATEEKRESGKKFTEEEIAKIDIILDKIKKSGYASLTEEEKNTLFKAGKK